VILEVKSLPANTRLAKAVAKHGLIIDVSIPPRANLPAWVRQWSQSRHGIQLAAATAQRLLERLGNNLGQVDQALARLAAATDPAAKKTAIQPEAIDDFAGSPLERTAWGMIDAAATGDAREAITQLASLLAAGENPIGISAQIASVVRRLSTAARLLALPAAGGRPAGIEQALREAGVAAWPKALAQARESLGQLGPRRARQLPTSLLDLDLSLKSDASRGLRARLALERLFCKMSRQAAAPASPRREPPTHQHRHP
jgi:DNA polymerase-3 subunit delta